MSYKKYVGIDQSERASLGVPLGSLASISVATLLVGVRGEIANANVALILVVCVLVGAWWGGRGAGVASTLAAAASFDFFHTRPYNSLKMTDGNDIVTTVLLLVVGLAVGEIAVRGRTRPDGPGRRTASAAAYRSDHRAGLVRDEHRRPRARDHG